jgi:hypothetical protein
VRFGPKLKDLVEFDVRLNSLPVDMKTGSGEDVMVSWKLLDGFSHDGIFYTDSNEGAMQERKYNHRNSWKFTDISSNISANTYPIDSAIAVRDNKY